MLVDPRLLFADMAVRRLYTLVSEYCVNWTCCRPPPTITWSRSGSPLSIRQNDARYRWSIGNHTLHIARLTLDDGGRYQCNASNSEGYRIYSVDLRVYSITAAFYYQYCSYSDFPSVTAMCHSQVSRKKLVLYNTSMTR